MSELDAEAKPAGFQDTAKDLFAGAAGGIAQVLIGQSNPKSNEAASKLKRPHSKWSFTSTKIFPTF